MGKGLFITSIFYALVKFRTLVKSIIKSHNYQKLVSWVENGGCLVLNPATMHEESLTRMKENKLHYNKKAFRAEGLISWPAAMSSC